MNLKNASTYAPMVLRLTLAVVYVWFGTSQIVNTDAWVSIIPSWATGLSGMDASTFVRMNGVMEITLGAFLALGIFVRWAALILSLHLLVIAIDFGITPIGVRDFGLALATFALALQGEDRWCVLYKQEKTVV